MRVAVATAAVEMEVVPNGLFDQDFTVVGGGGDGGGQAMAGGRRRGGRDGGGGRRGAGMQEAAVMLAATAVAATAIWRGGGGGGGRRRRRRWRRRWRRGRHQGREGTGEPRSEGFGPRRQAGVKSGGGTPLQRNENGRRRPERQGWRGRRRRRRIVLRRRRVVTSTDPSTAVDAILSKLLPAAIITIVDGNSVDGRHCGRSCCRRWQCDGEPCGGRARDCMAHVCGGC